MPEIIRRRTFFVSTGHRPADAIRHLGQPEDYRERRDRAGAKGPATNGGNATAGGTATAGGQHGGPVGNRRFDDEERGGAATTP
jgi:hypothetical protein